MSINSSDFSKQSVGALPVRQDHRADESFRALRQASTKAIQTSADSNKTSRDGGNKNSDFSSSLKIDPRTVDNANKKMSQLNVQLSFELTEDKSQNIVKVLDQTTGDVVRQMPTEEFLKMSKRIDAIMSQLSDIKGTLVNSQA